MEHKKEQPKDEKTPLPEERTSVTEHVIEVNAQRIKYVATAGMMHIRNDEEKTCAAIFYMAYTLQDTDPVNRPITFCFNGGPGSCSVWLLLWLFYADSVYIFILFGTDTSAGKSVDISSFTVPRRYNSRALQVSIAKFQRKNNPSFFFASLSPPFPPINQSTRR